MAEGDIYRYTVSAATVEELRQYLRDSGLDLGCRPIVKREPGRVSADAFASDAEMAAFSRSRTASGITVERGENMTAGARSARGEMAIDNRFADRARIPRGLGIKE
jgi:hypothetical protein